MPTLNEYAEKSEQSGYYVRAYAGGNSPITLQVSALGERIFDVLQYRSEETVPTKLIWSMYDIGILYTLSSLNTGFDPNESNEGIEVLNQVDQDSSLTPEEQNNVISKLKEYDGPDDEEVEKLLTRLQDMTFTEQSHKKNKSEPEAGTSLIRKWADDPSIYEKLSEDIEGYTEFASASIQTFAQHQYLDSPPIWVRKDKSIKYKLTHEKYPYPIYIFDSRFLTVEFAYKVIVDHGNGEKEIGEISETGQLIDYQNKTDQEGLWIRFKGMVEWITPSNPVPVHKKEGSNPTIESKISDSAIGTIAVHEDEKVEVIGSVNGVDKADIMVVSVDRINQKGPIATANQKSLRLDRGRVGKRYIIEKTHSREGRVLARFLP